MRSRTLTLLIMAALITSTTSYATAQQSSRASTGEATSCAVCIPPKYKAACDAEKSARKTCQDLLTAEQRTSQALKTSLDLGNELRARQANRIAELERRLDAVPDPPDVVFVAGVGALVGATAVVIVWAVAAGAR